MRNYFLETALVFLLILFAVSAGANAVQGETSLASSHHSGLSCYASGSIFTLQTP